MKLRSWYSVIGTNEVCPSANQILEAIRPRLAEQAMSAEGPENDWQFGTIRAAGDVSITVCRDRKGDQDFDDWVHSFAASEPWFREHENWEHVKDFVSRAKQRIVIRAMLGSRPYQLARVCEQLCGAIGRQTDGLIQVFQEGFFNLEGESLLPKQPSHRLKTS
jgi:hypothetical protein